MHPHLGSPKKLGVWTLAITLLLLQWGGTWHLAWNDHARCVEHGEWVEVEHPMAAPAPAQPARGPIVEAAGSIPRVHDHCSIFEASRARGIEWSGKLELSPLLSVERIASAPRSEPGDSPFALYLLAPKHSPPC